jgi:TIR domain/Effector-associated domain 1
MKREMTPTEYEELKEALLSAFPSPGSLEQMVAFKLGENLQVIAGGNNYGEVVFHLLQWVEAHNRTEVLITGARSSNLGNFKLRAFVERYLQHRSTISSDNERMNGIKIDQKDVEFPSFLSKEKKLPEREEDTAKSSNETRDFFISYTHTDQDSAEWVDWQLRNAGYSTVLQSKDFRPGSNFVLEMDLATRQARQTLLILSPDYLNALYAKSEWAAAFFKDPTGKEKALIPIRVRACEPEGLLGPIVYIDLVGLEEDGARKALLAGVLPRGESTFCSSIPIREGKSAKRYSPAKQ